MPITKEELLQLLGGEPAQSIQCAYTTLDENEAFAVCKELRWATHISVYLRVPCGEVVPVRDFLMNGSARGKARMAVLEIRGELGALPLEEHGPLAYDTSL